jgi:hypothetical protein
VPVKKSVIEYKTDYFKRLNKAKKLLLKREKELKNEVRPTMLKPMSDFGLN